MKIPVIGLATIICLLIASQASADLITPPGGYSASLDRKTEGSMTNTCAEEANTVTYRHITFLPSDEEADRAGITLYKLTDMMSVCGKRTDDDRDNVDAAPPSVVHYRN